jgi:thioester reductase-like protein
LCIVTDRATRRNLYCNYHYQVTGASGFIGSHVVDELLRQGYSVRGYAYILLQVYTVHSLMTVVSVVRSHNVPRVTKSYESFGNRFTTASIDDLATSDLSQVVKGLSCGSLPYF